MDSWKGHPWKKYPWQEHPWQKYPWQKHPWQKYPWQEHPWQTFPDQKHPGQQKTSTNSLIGEFIDPKVCNNSFVVQSCSNVNLDTSSIHFGNGNNISVINGRVFVNGELISDTSGSENIEQKNSKEEKDNDNYSKKPLSEMIGDECCICMDVKSQVIFEPCKHGNCCENCARKVTECPVCRQYITSKFKMSILEDKK